MLAVSAAGQGGLADRLPEATSLFLEIPDLGTLRAGLREHPLARLFRDPDVAEALVDYRQRLRAALEPFRARPFLRERLEAALLPPERVGSRRLLLRWTPPADMKPRKALLRLRQWLRLVGVEVTPQKSSEGKAYVCRVRGWRGYLWPSGRSLFLTALPPEKVKTLFLPQSGRARALSAHPLWQPAEEAHLVLFVRFEELLRPLAWTWEAASVGRTIRRVLHETAVRLTWRFEHLGVRERAEWFLVEAWRAGWFPRPLEDRPGGRLPERLPPETLYFESGRYSPARAWELLDERLRPFLGAKPDLEIGPLRAALTGEYVWALLGTRISTAGLPQLVFFGLRKARPWQQLASTLEGTGRLRRRAHGTRVFYLPGRKRRNATTALLIEPDALVFASDRRALVRYLDRPASLGEDRAFRRARSRTGLRPEGAGSQYYLDVPRAVRLLSGTLPEGIGQTLAAALPRLQPVCRWLPLDELLGLPGETLAAPFGPLLASVRPTRTGVATVSFGPLPILGGAPRFGLEALTNAMRALSEAGYAVDLTLWFAGKREEEGLRVVAVPLRGAAGRAGLRAGDLVLTVDGIPAASHPFTSLHLPFLALGTSAESHTLEILRAGRRLRLTVPGR